MEVGRGGEGRDVRGCQVGVCCAKDVREETSEERERKSREETRSGTGGGMRRVGRRKEEGEQREEDWVSYTIFLDPTLTDP